MTQSVYGWYGNVGRGFGGFPMAKCIMTKGFLTNLLVYTEIGYLLLLGMRGLCVVLGAVEDGGFDDIIFLSGLVIFSCVDTYLVCENEYAVCFRYGRNDGDCYGCYSDDAVFR